MVLRGRIRIASDWWFSKFCGWGLDSDWKNPQFAHPWWGCPTTLHSTDDPPSASHVRDEQSVTFCDRNPVRVIL